MTSNKFAHTVTRLSLPLKLCGVVTALIVMNPPVLAQRQATQDLSQSTETQRDPTVNNSFTASPEVDSIECTEFLVGLYNCGCGSTPLEDCLKRFKAANCHYESDGDALCPTDESD